jgi:hypothetical protein
LRRDRGIHSGAYLMMVDWQTAGLVLMVRRQAL